MPENLPVTSGLVLDLDADQITGVLDGGNVTTWSDTSGVGNNVTQGTLANRPNWENSLFQLGNRAAVQFNGSTDTLAANVLDLSGETGLTVFVVQYMSNHGLSGRTNACAVGRDTSGDRGYAVGSDNDGTLSGRAFLVIADSATTRVRRDGNYIDTRDLACLITARFDGSTEMSLRINGADDTGAIDGTIPATIANDGGTSFNIGSNGFADDWGGYIARVLIYDRKLTDDERDAMERWLMSRHQLIGMSETSEGPNTECHQGYTYDPVNDIHFTFDTAEIHRRLNDGSWTKVEENLAPFTGIATVNHLGDGDYYNGKLYVPMEFWGGSCGSFSDQYLAVFDAVTLERDSATSISAQAHEVSGCCVVPTHGTNGIVYVTSFCDDTQIFKYDLSTFAYLGAITLSGDTIDRLQGITFKEGWFYLSGSTGDIWRMNQNGLCKKVYHDARESGTVAYEGIDFHGSTLRWLIDEDTSSATADKHVHYLTLVSDGIGDDVQALQTFDPIFEPLEETVNPLSYEQEDGLTLEAVSLDRWHQPYETPEDPWPEFDVANVQGVVLNAELLQPPSTDFFICMSDERPVEESDGGVESFSYAHFGGLQMPPRNPVIFITPMLNGGFGAD